MISEFLGNPNSAALLIPILALLVAMVAIIANIWLKYKKGEMDAALKQDMVRQGMSADDIIRVLEAKSGNDGCGHRKNVPAETTDFKR